MNVSVVNESLKVIRVSSYELFEEFPIFHYSVIIWLTFEFP